MAKTIKDLPNFQLEFVENLVRSRFDDNHETPNFAGAILAKTPDGKHVLDITGASGQGSMIDVQSSDPYTQEGVEEAPIMNKLDMKKLVR